MVELSSDHRALLGTVIGSVEYCENTLRRQLEQRWNHFYALYRSYQVWKAGMVERQDRRDRDVGLAQARREWGADLFIPYVFTAVETEVPRLLAQPPQMLVLPRRKRWERNVLAVRSQFEAQVEQAHMELSWQTTAKSGLMYGLGSQKSRWRRSLGNRPVIQAQSIPNRPESEGIEYVSAGPESTVLWDDPDGEDVDIFDLFWDPMADSQFTATWMCHRVWRNTKYVLQMLGLDERGRAAQQKAAAAQAQQQPGAEPSGAETYTPRWNLVPGVTEEDIKSMGSPQKYTQLQSQRARASGLAQTDFKGRQVHEILEYHDGERVIVVLDRQLPVATYANPNWKGVLPFHVYRPTFVPHRFEGIGEPEAIEDLQIEMNVLRGQRRDNATLKLMQSFAYDEGAIDPDDIRFGPGELIPVAGPPGELLFPLTVGDIPNSSYREAAEISADIQRVTGISDLASGGEGGSGGALDTATGSQLVIAATNERIRNKTKRFGLEVVVDQADYWGTLNQTHIQEERDIRVPYIPQPGEPDRRWAWIEGVGPPELAGEYEWHVVADSMSPVNVQQDRADFQSAASLVPALAQLFNMPKMAGWMLEKLGIEDPEAYLAMPNMVPPQVLELIKKFIVEQATAQGANPQKVAQEADSMIQQAIQGAEEQQAQINTAGAPNTAGGPPPAAPGEQQSAPAAPVPEPQQQGAAGKGQDNRRKA